MKQTKGKIENTILYLLNTIKRPLTKDELKLLLYFVDFDYYEKHEKPFFKNIKWVKGKKHPELLPSSQG